MERKKHVTILNQKNAAVCLFVLFLVSLLPVFYLSGYVHATGDDYGYGAGTHSVWLETHSLWQTLRMAAATSKEYWYGWQCTWFTIFLMALQPEVFWPNGYFIVPWLMLGLTVFSTSLLLYYFLVRRLELKKETWLITDILLLTAMIQFFPYTTSSVFWYNGAVHYIVPYSLALVAIYVSFRFVDTKRKRDLALSCLCMFCLGGSSYLSALLAFIVIVWLILFLCRKKKYVLWLLVPAGIELTGLVVSFLAPGNKARGGEDFGLDPGRAAWTIGRCFAEGTYTAAEYIKAYPAVFVCFLMILFVLAEAFAGQEERKKFPLPGLFTGMMFCLYCAMFAPGIYAGVEVSGGVPNTIFQVFLLCFLAVLVYWTGWYYQKKSMKAQKEEGMRRRFIFAALFFVSLLLLYTQKGTLKDATFFECYEYISSGQADDYKAQMEERLAILRDDSQKDVQLPAMNDDQGPLMHMEVMEDPDEWTNTVVRKFFQKNSVVEVPREG